ncbi:MAG: SDR family oxidoreductase [archaeon]
MAAKNTNKLNLSEMFHNSLKGKVFVVTGAGSGLGKALSLSLAFSGAKVGLLDINETAITKLKQELDENYGKDTTFVMVASVSDDAQLEKAYSALVNEYGRLDGLINCAGIAKLGSINEVSAHDIKLSNDININGYFLNANIASKLMIKSIAEKKTSTGCIINISSASARGISEATSLYGTSKEADCMMVRLWATDLGKHNIRVNAILPGDLFGNEEAGIDSGIWNQKYFEKKAIYKGLVKEKDSRIGGQKLDPDIRKLVIDHYVSRTSLRKEITYADVAHMMLFLCSDLCEKVTGESIPVTSGNPAAFSR